MRTPWSRFVALGDSLTEGIGDPGPAGLRGWADRVAASLRIVRPELEFHNLARRSLMAAEVRDSQVAPARALRPDLVSAVVGMNDVIGRGFDAGAFRAELDGIVGPFADAGATVLMGTFPDDLPLLRLMPPARRRSLRSNLEAATAAVREVAAARGAICLAAASGWRYGMNECSVDGCHPNARGHLHIARLAIAALSQRAGVDLPPPDDRDSAWISSTRRHVQWLVTQGYFLRAPARLLAVRRGG